MLWTKAFQRASLGASSGGHPGLYLQQVWDWNARRSQVSQWKCLQVVIIFQTLQNWENNPCFLLVDSCYSQTHHWSQHQWPCWYLAFQPNTGAAAQTKSEESSSLLGSDFTNPERAASWLGLEFNIIFLLKKKPWDLYVNVLFCTFLSFQGKAYYQWVCISLLKI